MNSKEKTNGIWNPVWPDRRAAWQRLLLIVVVLLPCEWAVYALLVGDWKLNLTEGGEEPIRHLIEGTVIFGGAVSIIFLASLLPVFGRFGRFLGWLSSPRIARRVVFAAVWAVTFVVLLYAEENWRGARAWNKYRQQLEASGVQLDWAKFIPKPVPDEQNFANTPVVKSWFVEVDRTVFTNTTERFAKNWQDNYARVFDHLASPKDKSSRHFIDLVAWAKALDKVRSGQTNLNEEPESGELSEPTRAAAAPPVLEGLETNEAVLAEIQIASQREFARYPVFYDLENPWGIFLPHLINVRDACRRLQLRACADLAAGRSNGPMADVKLMLYLANSVKEEPFLISHLVRLACVQLATQVIWEGLAEHAWSDAQLLEIQSIMGEQDFLPALKSGFDSERAAGVMFADSVRKRGLGFLLEVGGSGPIGSMQRKSLNWCGAFVPRGWYDLERLNYCRLFQLQIEGVFDATSKRVFPNRLKTNSQDLDRAFAGREPFNTVINHRVISTILLPALGSVSRKTAEAQTAADQAALACALERFRRTKGNYPEKLDELVPGFIAQMPHDVITGKSFTYRAMDGQFLLYSIGWDEKDDGGVPGKTLFDEGQGDWVWRSN